MKLTFAIFITFALFMTVFNFVEACGAFGAYCVGPSSCCSGQCIPYCKTFVEAEAYIASRVDPSSCCGGQRIPFRKIFGGLCK